MNKRWIFVAVMALSGTATAAPFVYPAKWTSTPASAVKTGGTFNDYTLGDYKTVNPFESSEADSIPLTLAAGSGLFTLDPTNLEYIPKMAETYKISANKLVWTMNLRSGIKWTDGSPVTADDFVTSAKIHADENVGSNEYSSFYVNNKPIKIEKVDKDTIKAIFPSVTADAIADLTYTVWPSKIFGPVYAAKGAAGIKGMWTISVDPKEVVSAGQWKYVGYRPGERAQFVKNPYFGEWNKDSAGKSLPYLDGLNVTLAKDLNSAFAQYLAGQIDAFAPRNTDDLAQIKKSIDAGQLKAVLRPSVSPAASSSWIVFNWNRKSEPFKQNLFRSTQFRRAMSYLVNRQAMVDIVYGGLAQPAYSSVYAVFGDWVSPALQKYDFNPEAAKKLLASIGFAKKNSDGYLINNKKQVLEFDLNTNAGNNNREQMAKIFADEAKKVGVKVNFKPIDFNSLVTALTSTGDDRKFDAILLGLSNGSPIFPLGINVDPCGTNLHAFNTSGKCITPWETQVTALFARGQAELDIAKRKTTARKIQDIQSSEQAFVYLVSPTWHASWNARIKGEYPQGVMNAFVTQRDSALTWINP